MLIILQENHCMIISAETHFSGREIMTKIHQTVRVLAVFFQNQPDAEIIGSQLCFEGNLEPFINKTPLTYRVYHLLGN